MKKYNYIYIVEFMSKWGNLLHTLGEFDASIYWLICYVCGWAQGFKLAYSTPPELMQIKLRPVGNEESSVVNRLIEVSIRF